MYLNRQDILSTQNIYKTKFEGFKIKENTYYGGTKTYELITPEDIPYYVCIDTEELVTYDNIINAEQIYTKHFYPNLTGDHNTIWQSFTHKVYLPHTVTVNGIEITINNQLTLSSLVNRNNTLLDVYEFFIDIEIAEGTDIGNGQIIKMAESAHIATTAPSPGKDIIKETTIGDYNLKIICVGYDNCEIDFISYHVYKL